MVDEVHADENDGGYKADVSSSSDTESDANSFSSDKGTAGTTAGTATRTTQTAMILNNSSSNCSSSSSISSISNSDEHHRHHRRRSEHHHHHNNRRHATTSSAASVIHLSRRMKRRREHHHHHNDSNNHKRRTATTQLQSCISPIHPDIDMSMTSLMSSAKFLDDQRVQQLQCPLQLPRAVRQAQVDVLSQLLMDFFAAPKSIALIKPSSCSSTSGSMVKEDGMDEDGLGIDLPSISPGTNAMLSSKMFFLEDALSLSSSPRLLIEAKKPHRVTYANAAFSHGMLGDQTNMHRWVEQQNSPESQQIHLRTLDSVIQDVFANAPVVVYPVLGSGKVSHYLVEAVPTNVVPATTTMTTEGTSSSSRMTKHTMTLQKTQQHRSELESSLSQTVG